MATEWISPTWRMPEESNQSKFENYSLDFGGSAKIDYATPVDLGVVSTFSFWMNIDVGTTGALFGNTALGTFEYVVYYSGSGFFFKIAGAYADFPNAATAISTGQWHHVTFVRPSENEVKCYIDSVLTDTITSWTGTPGSNPIKFDLIGSRPGGGLAYSGKMGQIAGFNSALTSAQITALYNSGTPINPMAITPPPTAYYPLGGSSTGSASTLTIPNSSVPSATVFDFDGSNKITGTGDLISGNESRSFSLWYKTTSTAAQIPFSLGSPTDQTNGAQFAYCINRSSTTNAAIFGKNSAYDTSVFTVPNTSDGNWHHLLVTYNQSALKVYIDGNLEATPALPSSSYITSAGFTIGGWTIVGNRLFNGEISNVQVWNAELESSDVTTLYNNGVPYTGTQPQAANLKAWYKMNVDTSTWNGSDWLISNSGITPTYTEGLFFGGGYVGGSPSATYAGMRLTNQAISSDHVTYSFWYKRVIPNSGASDGMVLTGIGGSSAYLGAVDCTSNSKIKFGGDTATEYINFDGPISDGAWHHIMVYYPNTNSFSSDDVICFVDGDEATRSHPPVPFTATSGPVTEIRGTLLESVPLNVELSNWSYFLSDQTGNINTIYNGGTPGDISSLNPSVWLKYDSATTAFAGATGANYGLATDSSGNSNNGNLAGRTDGTTTKLVTSNVQSGSGVSNGMTTANLVNSDLTRSIPYSSYSMEFDGTLDYIQIPSSADLIISGDLTISFWFKTSASSGVLTPVMLYNDQVKIYMDASDGLLRTLQRGASTFTTVGTTAVNDGNWHLCTAILGLSETKVYLDNAILESSDSGFTRTTTAGGNAIGSRYYSSANSLFNGNMSNVAIWNTSLTQDQVLTIYNGGVPNDISSLSPVSWWSLAGDSYFDGNDFICPDLGSGNNNGTSDGMGGTELVGDGPGSSANGIATSMDIPANLKGNAPNSSKNAFSVNMNSADRFEDVPA